MPRKAIHPKHPVKAALVGFAILAACVAAAIPFDERIRGAWPFAFGYCALLAVAGVGLVRLGQKVLWLLGVPLAVALAPGAFGFALLLDSGGAKDLGADWLRVSLYLCYALAAWMLCLVVKGWSLYLGHPHQASQPGARPPS